MRRDHETTDLASAAAFERNNTPGYDERADRYEPDGYVRNSWPIEELRAVFGPMTRQLRCAHGHCRTSLAPDEAVVCPHNLSFCGNCTWEEECGECAAEAVRPPTYGMCTACGAVEVALTKATGTRNLSGIGEHPAYPTGDGCEVCA